jgi:hypothetical protein
MGYNKKIYNINCRNTDGDLKPRQRMIQKINPKHNNKNQTQKY